MKVTCYDNRGTTEEPYGFVYFNDGRRVVYSRETGVTTGTGGWDAVTEDHQAAATAYLQENGVLPAPTAG